MAPRPRTTKRAALLCGRPLGPGLLCAVLAIATALPTDAGPASEGSDARPRLVVTTDIGGDPDDIQSLVRLLVYANEFEIEGLVASASGTPNELSSKVTRPYLIHQAIDAYEQVLPRLRLHDVRFPEADDLRRRVVSGNPERGRGAIGESQQTAGSKLLVEALLRSDAGPLNVAIWGGQTDLAQALWEVRHQHGDAALRQCLSRLRVHDIQDQDGLFGWLASRFEFSCYVLSKADDGRDKRESAYRGMYLGGDESLTSLAWLSRHVIADHGPLGTLYPTKTWTAPNPHAAMKEGDTPSWFYFLPNGLHDPDRPDWGGWGGRFMESSPGVWRNAPGPAAPQTVSRWRPYFQAEFAARMDWCVSGLGQANHAPRAQINGDAALRPLLIDGGRGGPVKLDASGSSDPDADPLEFRWWVDGEAGGEAMISAMSDRSDIVSVALPPDGLPKDVHVILEVADSGSPSLIALRRIVISPGSSPE